MLKDLSNETISGLLELMHTAQEKVHSYNLPHTESIIARVAILSIGDALTEELRRRYPALNDTTDTSSPGTSVPSEFPDA